MGTMCAKQQVQFPVVGQEVEGNSRHQVAVASQPQVRHLPVVPEDEKGGERAGLLQ
jgi:hypothetical protein